MSQAQTAPPPAWPFWLTLTFVPLVAMSVTQGGWWIAFVPVYGWVLTPIADRIFGRNLRNPDPNTPDEHLFWHRLLTWIWFPIQLVLVYWSIWYLTHRADHTTAETIGIMFGIGLTTGMVGIVYAHELMHKSSRFERMLADLLMALVLYSHFRTEHLLVHHPWVGTPRDTVTARYNEGFHRYFPRVLLHGPASAWRAERARLRRANLPVWHRRNPFWRYAFLQTLFLAISFVIGGWAGVGLFVFQAFIAIWLLELTNYVEHYGLTRKYLGDGKYEPVRPHHSWDSTHLVTNLVLINLQRHADHHVNPMRRFPLLQAYGPGQVPQLPTGYPPMTAMAMIPPLWRRRFNPRVRAWRKQFYPEITDWTPYKKWEYPAPEGAG